jgi:hypothetical protein
VKTLELFSRGLASVPTVSAWYLEAIGRSQGRQELFERQSPERLRRLREHALVESAVSSNRIEGVEVDRRRVATLVFGTDRSRDRNEEELRGYRRALEWIHDEHARIAPGEETCLRLHALARGELWDGGRYKERDGDIIETYPDGRSRVRFQTVLAARVPAAMRALAELSARAARERFVPEPIRIAAANLDFLCIHPFRDGNGRVSRLLLLLEAYRAGLGMGRYVSLERIVEQNKERYYETLEQSSAGWHDGAHDPWPYVNFVLFVFKEAYRELEERFEGIQGSRGEKAAAVRQAVAGRVAPFTVQDLRRDCPGAGDDTIRRVLRSLKSEGQVECLGRGPHARWRKIGDLAVNGR